MIIIDYKQLRKELKEYAKTTRLRNNKELLDMFIEEVNSANEETLVDLAEKSGIDIKDYYSIEENNNRKKRSCR